MGLRAPDLPRDCQLCALDHGLSPLRPAFVGGVTQIDAHSRQICRAAYPSLDDGDDVYNWPWLYGVEVGYWDLTDDECKKMRDYLLRGGFFMCDDFHGTREWTQFMNSMRRVFPDRPVVEIDNKDAIFHIVFDLDSRYQVPGAQFLETGRLYEHDGFGAPVARHL